MRIRGGFARLGRGFALLAMCSACGLGGEQFSPPPEPAPVVTTSPETPVATTSPVQASTSSTTSQMLSGVAESVAGTGLRFGSVEHLDYLRICLAEAGFTEIDIDIKEGVMTGRTPPGQEAVFNETLAECMQRGIDQGLVLAPQPPSEDQLARIFQAFTEITQPCLLANGYPTSPPPSLESYIESDGSNWHPYDAIPYANLYVAPGVAVDSRLNDQVAAWHDLRETCPADVSVLLPDLSPSTTVP